MEPGTGKALWCVRFGRGGVQGGVLCGSGAEGSIAYIPINGVADPEDVTRYRFKTTARHGMFALDAATGEVR